MARTMQCLSEGIFINNTNLTLACRDSYLDYLRAGIKQDTLTAVQNAPLHMHSLFSDQLLVKAEEILHDEEMHSTSTSQKKPGLNVVPVIAREEGCFLLRKIPLPYPH